MGKSCSCCECEICSNRIIEKIVLTAKQGESEEVYTFNINKKFSEIADEKGEAIIYFGDHSRIRRLIKENGQCIEKNDFKRKLQIVFKFPTLALFTDFKIENKFLVSDEDNRTHSLLFPEEILADPVSLDYLGNKIFLSFEPANNICPTIEEIKQYLFEQIREIHDDLKNELITISVSNPIIDTDNPLNMGYDSQYILRRGSINTSGHPMVRNNSSHLDLYGCQEAYRTYFGRSIYYDLEPHVTYSDSLCQACPAILNEDLDVDFFGGHILLKSDCAKNCIYSKIFLNGEYILKGKLLYAEWLEHPLDLILSTCPNEILNNPGLFPGAGSFPSCYCADVMRAFSFVDGQENVFTNRINMELEQVTHSCCNSISNNTISVPRFRTIPEYDLITKKYLKEINNGYSNYINSYFISLFSRFNYTSFISSTLEKSNCFYVSYETLTGLNPTLVPNPSSLFYPVSSIQLTSTIDDVVFEIDIVFSDSLYPPNCYNEKIYIDNNLVDFKNCFINCGTNNELSLKVNLNGTKNNKHTSSSQYTEYFSILKGLSEDYIDRFCEKNASTVYYGEIESDIHIVNNNIILNKYVVVNPYVFHSGIIFEDCLGRCRGSLMPDFHNDNIIIKSKFNYFFYKQEDNYFLAVDFNIYAFKVVYFYKNKSNFDCSNIPINSEDFYNSGEFSNTLGGIMLYNRFYDKQKIRVPTFNHIYSGKFQISEYQELFTPKSLSILSKVGDGLDYGLLDNVTVEFLNG